MRWVKSAMSDRTIETRDGGFVIDSGSDCSSVVLHVPHAATTIPPWVRSKILLDDAALARELELMTDAQTDLIALVAAEDAGIRPWVLRNALSRLVVDPERFPDPEQEPMAAPEIGMGAVYTKTAHLDRLRDHDREHEEQLLEQYFRPYARGLSDVVGAALQTVGRVTIIDVHSFPAQELPYERLHHADAARPTLCLGVDEFHTPPWLVDAALGAFSVVKSIGINEPFAGTYVPLEFYGVEPQVTSIMVEIRRDTYVDDPTAIQSWGEAIRRLIDAVASSHESA